MATTAADALPAQERLSRWARSSLSRTQRVVVTPMAATSQVTAAPWVTDRIQAVPTITETPAAAARSVRVGRGRSVPTATIAAISNISIGRSNHVPAFEVDT